MKIVRIVFLAFILALLAYAFLKETHEIHSLSDDASVKKESGREFTETASYDGVIKKDGKLYDLYSLTPERLQEKDCST